MRSQANNQSATAHLLDFGSDLLEQRIGIGPYDLPGKPGMGVQQRNKEPPGLQGGVDRCLPAGSATSKLVPRHHGSWY